MKLTQCLDNYYNAIKNRYYDWLDANYDTTILEIAHKIQHTKRVVDNTIILGTKLNLSDEQIFVAKIIALLHDIYRAEQITLNDSFVDYDGQSDESIKRAMVLKINHADGAVNLLKEDNCKLLRYFIPESRYDHLILPAIFFHSKLAIDESFLTEEQVFFCKLIRDADKLDSLYARARFDMFRVEGWNKEEVSLSFISDEIYNAFVEERTIIGTDRKTLADQYFFILAFVFGLYFKQSYEIIIKENYIAKIRDVIEFKDEITQSKAERMYDMADEFVVRKSK